MKKDIRDRAIIHLVESQLGVEIDDYNIQGIETKGDITYININVKPKLSTEFIDVEFSVKRPPEYKNDKTNGKP